MNTISIPKKLVRSSFSSCFLLLLLFVVGTVSAVTRNVSSVAALQTAINNANPGDIIILANGTYLNSTLTIGTSNITVKAATPGGVYWNSDVNTSSLLTTAAGNRITISGDHITLSGFQFTSGDIGLSYILEITGNYNVVTELNFSGYYAQKYIHINDPSQYNEISFCNLEKKPAAAASGCTIQINTSATVPGYHKIRYCSFQNYEGVGGDFGNEPIRIGLSTENNNASRSIVEHCYFNNTGLGDSESVSIKSMENTIRFCTFTNQQNAMLCFRNGDNNAAYSNFFINAGGIRVKEANNIYCYNNYFYNSGVGSSADAVTLEYVIPAALRTSNLVNINFIHNTFVDCGSIDMGGTGATNNTWANTIFKKSSGAIFANANTGTTWAGNIYQGTLGISIPSGMTNVDPQLVTNSDGYYGISSSSPAINSASASYPAILDIANVDDDPALLLDISGQPRLLSATSKDVGCDEYATGVSTNHPLLLSEVGPSYLVVKQNQTITFGALSPKVFGDIDFSAGATTNAGGLTVLYTSSNTDVATIVSGNIHIIGVGTAIITASQPGDLTYSAAGDVQQTLTVNKADQTITFVALPSKVVGETDFSAAASASSGLTVSLTSSNTDVATIVSDNIHIVGAGVATITASQVGNTNYNAATIVSRTLTVTELLTHTIAFVLPLKYTNSADFDPLAVSSIGSLIIYTSSNPAVATIVNSKIHIVGKGTSNITASAMGNGSYDAATNTQQLIVQCSCVQ